MKFKAEKTIADAIAEITKQFNLGDPSDFLLYLPEGTEGAVTGWADNKAALASFDLKHKVPIYLKSKDPFFLCSINFLFDKNRPLYI